MLELDFRAQSEGSEFAWVQMQVFDPGQGLTIESRVVKVGNVVVVAI